MKKIRLKANHILFSWYYKKVGEHFRQFTFLASVKLLIEHYYFERDVLHKGTRELYNSCFKQNERLEKELRNIRLNQVATEGQIDLLNNSFATSFKKPSEN